MALLGDSTAAASASAAALARSLHRAAHYDLSFRAVSHTFAPQSREYQEALIQLTWPIAAAATLVLLV